MFMRFEHRKTKLKLFWSHMILKKNNDTSFEDKKTNKKTLHLSVDLWHPGSFLICADLAKNLLIHCESELQDVCDVIVLHPLKRLMELLIQVLQIWQVCWSEGRQSWHMQLPAPQSWTSITNRSETFGCGRAPTAGAAPCRRVWWKMHPAGTDGSEPGPEYDHWTETWKHKRSKVYILFF